VDDLRAIRSRDTPSQSPNRQNRAEGRRMRGCCTILRIPASRRINGARSALSPVFTALNVSLEFTEKLTIDESPRPISSEVHRMSVGLGSGLAWSREVRKRRSSSLSGAG
jgi:hypothetical protein